MLNSQSVTITSNMLVILKPVWHLQEIQKEDFLPNNGKSSK